MSNNDVYTFCETQITAYDTNSVPLEDNWDWNMKKHIRRCFLVKNSKFSKGANDGERPNNNIVLPIANVAYRTEGFDVKDIVPFVNDRDNYYKSFLIKKYHPRFARKNNLDTFIDDVVESQFDYGLAFVRDVDEVKPDLIPLQSLAFCDQTNIMKGPFAIRHSLTIDELEDMKGKWWSDKVDMAVAMAKNEKATVANGLTAKTPGKYVEIYEIHGVMNTNWLSQKKEGEEGYEEEREYYGTKKYTRQVQVIMYYLGENNTRVGLTLYAGKEAPGLFKAYVRNPIFGRACGRSGIEELFDPQVWANYSEIRLKDMLDAAALSVIKTTDPKFAQRNKTKDLKNNEVLLLEQGTDAGWMSNDSGRNYNLFADRVKTWEEKARTIGSASESQLGITPSSGVPLGTTQLVTAQGVGTHTHQQGKIATFFSEIYRDWGLKYVVREMNNGQKFFEELSVDELKYVVDGVTTNALNKRIKAMMIKKGELPDQMAQDFFKSRVQEQFKKGDGKYFMEAVKGELENLPVDVEVNIAGKQRDLAARADKLNSIFGTIFKNPQILQVPGMGDLFNDIIESSGFNPVDFTSLTRVVQTPETKPGVEGQGGAIKSEMMKNNLVTA